MSNGSIEKDRIAELIAAMSEEYAVYGPKAAGDVITFRRVSSAEEMVLNYRNSTVSPKELFLPRTEVLYEFDGEGFVDDALPDEKRVVFAIRPCDCRALTLLDRVFDTDDVKDPFYLARRENTVLVALACSRPLSTCFCTSLGGDPFGEDGVDVLLGDVGDSLLAKELTPKGKNFMASYGKFFSGKGSADWKKQAKQARARITSGLEVEEIKSHLDQLFDDEIWQTVSQKCLGCGTCSYLCPTCYCFDLTDEKTKTGAKKIRSWDCCMFPSFTLHASGHNPRAVIGALLRQKIMHKFSYYTERYGVHDCVGCGRCVRSCPVNVDIRQLLAEIIATSHAGATK